MMELQNFRAILANYRAVFFDAFGVVKNYKGLVPGIHKTFDYLRDENKDFFIVTNDASRSPQQLAESYHNMGLEAITAEHIISSGMLAKEFLDLKVKDGIVAYLGPPNSAHYIDSSGLHTMPISKVNDTNMKDVSALVFLDDEGFNWSSDLNKAVNLLRKHPIPAIVANTDYAYPRTADQVSIAIGGIAKMIETIVGRDFIRFGKPDSQMFMFAYDIIRSKKAIGKKEILMVGDTLHTDILGGNKFGLDTVLVFSGNTLERDAETRINSTGIVPTYICQNAVVD